MALVAPELLALVGLVEVGLVQTVMGRVLLARQIPEAEAVVLQILAAQIKLVPLAAQVSSSSRLDNKVRHE